MTESSSRQVTDLIAKARQGDALCRDRLFELCRSYLGFMARSQVEPWLQRKVDASDLVQQTMLEAHCGFERFQGTSEKEFLAWLKRIMQHNAADFVRRYGATAKREARREVPFRNEDDSRPVGAPEPPAPGPTPSQELALLDEELRVTNAMAQLPDDYQEVIVLRHFQRLPFNDVAERMGRSRPAVQMLWMRAIRRLEELLTDNGPTINP